MTTMRVVPSEWSWLNRSRTISSLVSSQQWVSSADQLGVVDEGAGHAHTPLLLAAGELAGQVAGAVGQTHAVRRRGSLFVGHQMVVLRDHDVLEAVRWRGGTAGRRADRAALR